MNFKDLAATLACIAAFTFVVFSFSACTVQEEQEMTKRNAQNNAAILELSRQGCADTVSYPLGVRCERWRVEP